MNSNKQLIDILELVKVRLYNIEYSGICVVVSYIMEESGDIFYTGGLDSDNYDYEWYPLFKEWILRIGKGLSADFCYGKAWSVPRRLYRSQYRIEQIDKFIKELQDE